MLNQCCFPGAALPFFKLLQLLRGLQHKSKRNYLTTLNEEPEGYPLLGLCQEVCSHCCFPGRVKLVCKVFELISQGPCCSKKG